MKKKSTQKNRKTIITQLSWMGVLVASLALFVTCYEFTTLDQPEQGFTNTPFEVPVVLKQDGEADFNYDLKDLGCFGIQLPEGWTVKDSIEYSVKGTYVAVDPFQPYEFIGYIVQSDDYNKMYEDSVGSKEGYYWWGGISSDSAHVDKLDSISFTVTIIPDGQVGNFELQYAMGTLDYWERHPVAVISDMMPITISDNTNVNDYLKNQISVYPIPAADVLTVDVGNIRTGEIQLFDVTGKLQKELSFISGVNRINVGDYDSGIYVLKVKTSAGEYSQRIFITR